MAKHVLMWSTAFMIFLSAHNARKIHIPRGRAAHVDGKVSPGEWDDAGSTQILIQHEWKVRVRFKYDDENMYFLFEDVMHGNERLFPEIFVDPQGRKGPRWVKGEWWFHVSYNLCEGDGEPNVYRKNGVFQCAHHKDGWTANNPPDKDSQAVEVSVSFSKLGIRPTSGLHLGLAFDVTNATGDETQKWLFWPPTAKVGSPNTWGEAVLN